MKMFKMSHILCNILLLLLFYTCVQAAQTVSLPAPHKDGGMPLMQALAERKTSRSFSDKAISEQTLSDLLWATWGISRSDGRHTAPTARNQQQVEVYVVMANGVWRYDSTKHQLEMVMEGDQRKKVGGAPLTLLYAAPADDQWAGVHVGSLYQNAGLFCASAKLANAVRANGTDGLKDAFPLPKGFRLYITHAVGWPG